jgi:hypothetical protein
MKVTPWTPALASVFPGHARFSGVFFIFTFSASGVVSVWLIIIDKRGRGGYAPEPCLMIKSGLPRLVVLAVEGFRQYEFV